MIKTCLWPGSDLTNVFESGYMHWGQLCLNKVQASVLLAVYAISCPSGPNSSIFFRTEVPIGHIAEEKVSGIFASESVETHQESHWRQQSSELRPMVQYVDPVHWSPTSPSTGYSFFMAFFSKKTLKTGFSVHFFIRFRFRKRFRVFLYAFAFESVFPLSLSKIRFRCFCGQIKFPSKSGISFLPLFQKQTWFRSELRQDVIDTT